MIKTYKLTIPSRNTSFVLRGKTGNSQRFNFAGGDPVIGKAATIMLHTQYSQYLLESSDEFKKGIVVLVRTDEGGEIASPTVNNVMENIKSPEQLIEFVATVLEKVYQRPEAALNYAKSKGYEFPNLTLKKAEE